MLQELAGVIQKTKKSAGLAVCEGGMQVCSACNDIEMPEMEMDGFGGHVGLPSEASTGIQRRWNKAEDSKLTCFPE
jgi:hypothetical protein